MRVTKRKNRGFTLIELLVVTMMLAVISLAIYATLSNGVRLWKTINGGMRGEDLDIFFERMASDVRNSIKYSTINFVGGPDSFEFAAIVNSPRLGVRSVGKVKYEYDSAQGTVTREVLDYSAAYEDGKGDQMQALCDVKSLKLQYYVYDETKKEYFWQDEWALEGLPLAVRLEVEINYGSGAELFTKTVTVPLG